MTNDRCGGEDKLLRLLEKIPDEKNRKDILNIIHNAIIEHPQAYIIILDKNGNFLFENKSIHGMPIERVIGKPCFSDFEGKVHPRDMKMIIKVFQEALNGKVVEAEVGIADGRIFSGTFMPIKRNAKVEYVIMIVYDITYQREIEELRKAKKIYEEGVKDVFLMRILFPSGICDYVSPSFKNFTGYEIKEGINVISLFLSHLHPDFREEVRKKWERLVSGDIPPKMMYKARTKTGEYRWFYQTNSGVYDKDGDLIAVDIVVRDFTEQKALEDELRDFGEKFNLILKEGKIALFTAIYSKAEENVIAEKIIFTDSIKNITGYDAKDFLDDPELLIKIAYAGDFNRVIEQFFHQFKEENEVDIVSRFIRKDGFIGKIKIWGKIFRNENGKPMRIEGIAMDATDKDVYDDLLDYFAKKLAERKIKASEAFYIH